MTFRIRNWNELYENNRTRDLKRLDWVPIPNRMDGDGYTELLDHPNGAAHLGAWIALVQIASKCQTRGTLSREGGAGHDPKTLSRISRIPAAIFEEAIPRFVEIGWLENITVREFKLLQAGAEIPQLGAGKPQDDAGIPQEGAPSRARDEGKGMEGKGKNGTDSALAISALLEDSVERLYARHPKKRNLPLVGVALMAALERSPDPNALMAEIDRAHIAWCKTPDWNESNGKFAPKLDEWIADRGWTKLPDARASPAPNMYPDADEWKKGISQ